MVIYGQVPSKSNGYRVTCIAGRGQLYKTKELKTYEKNFGLQYKRHPKILGNFELVVSVYFRSNKSDLDGMFKVVLDCLQSVCAIDNDRYCMRIVASKYVDKENPRIEITLNSLEDESKTKSSS